MRNDEAFLTCTCKCTATHRLTPPISTELTSYSYFALYADFSHANCFRFIDTPVHEIFVYIYFKINLENRRQIPFPFGQGITHILSDT